MEEGLWERIDLEINALEASGDDRFRGPDWYQVSDCEQEVFGLLPEMMARVVTVYEIYAAIADIDHNDFHGTDLCVEARQAYPWIEPRRIDIESFQRFASLFDISNRQAHAFLFKHAFWEIRQGIAGFKDEAKDKASLKHKAKPQYAYPASADFDGEIPF